MERVAALGTRDGTSLRELAGLFLKLGTIAFGGPAAHIAMMEEEVVHRRRWLTRDEFLDYLGATNLIPGPNSTELAIHIGHARAGRLGLLVAGVSFILPATLIVGAIAWAYVRFGTLPAVASLLYGVKPVIVAVIVQALWRLARTALKTPGLWGVGLLAVLVTVLGMNEILVLLGAGSIMALVRSSGSRPSTTVALATAPLIANAAAWAAGAGSTSLSMWMLFGVFAKAGAVLFGSGYVLLAFLRADLVERLQWLTEQQLLDAVAVGQVTPGPVFTTATFIGFVLGGAKGAAIATVGIFLPAFAFVAVSGPLVPRLRRSATAGAVLDGVNVASLALMFVVTVHLARTALVDIVTVALSVCSAYLLFRVRINPAWLVLGGAAVGLLSAALVR